MKAEDLRTKTVDELNKLLLDTRKAQFNMRFQKSQGTMENTAEIRNNRRNIARIKTFLNQKEVGEAAKPAAKKAAPKKAAAKKTETKKAETKKPAAKKTAKKSSEKAT